jgi:hypothetical protein
MNLLTQKELPSSMLLMYYPTTDYPHELSQIETHISHPPSQKNSANSFKSTRTSAPPTTPKLMVNQNAPINGQYLHIFVNFQQNNWASWLPLAQYTHNSWPNTTTKKAQTTWVLGK